MSEVENRRARNIEIGEAAARVINEKVMQAVFEEMDLMWWSDLKGETDPAAREFIRAKACALEELWGRLEALVDSGTRARLDQAAEDAGPSAVIP